MRIEGDKVHEAQKRNALIYGRAVDGFRAILRADLEPVEKALQDAEDTAERAETARKDALEAGRKALLAPYVPDVTLYAVRDMAEPVFAAMLAGVKLAKEQADAAAAKAEADRIAKEKEEAAERERIRAENEKLRQEAIAREAAAKIERERIAKETAEREAREAAAEQERQRLAKIEREKHQAELCAAEQKRIAEQRVAEEKARKEREAVEAKARAEKAAADAIAKKEREAREKAERELAVKKAAEEKEAKRIAAEAEKAAAAPDKAKLLACAASVAAIAIPKMATHDGELRAADVAKIIKRAADEIRALANSTGELL